MPQKDFMGLNASILIPLGLLAINIQTEEESQEYAALKFDLGPYKIKFRTGKSTPKKAGHFVSLWKREKGVTLPHDGSDAIDFIMIAAKERTHKGYFIFSKQLLIEKKIFSFHDSAGKRGIRIYAPWVHPQNQQALKTQEWQKKYFYTENPDERAKQKLAKLLKPLDCIVS